MEVNYLVRLSQLECVVENGDARAWLEGKPPKPISVSLTHDPQRCTVQLGNHLQTSSRSGI
jgi:hypothetical protein